MDRVDNRNNNRSLEILKEIFENVNRWLQFAEAKNGALVGLNGFFLLKSIDFLFDVINGNIKVDVLLVGGIVAIFFLAMLIALKSFFPNTSVHKDKPDVNYTTISNDDKILIFFEEICKYENCKLYLRDIYKYYLDIDVKIEDLKKIELDYAKEILINCRITSFKYKFFKIALVLNIIGISAILLFIIIA
ncbi:hypothetical protein [Caminicella sporogenes]|uniref:hypothetical protein n=1 Tax=Caminicella sporogenes TaxID=166485 RepID=UPI00253FD432|nr:hypothetical protein [Caminicella sporogenes]WIF95471.1 hypothetical protein QNI18_02175 [Caminicella sporogenes]